MTGTPRTSPSNALAAMAFWIFSKSKTLVTGWSFPDAAIQRPDGSVSMPCGDFGIGRK